MHETVYLLDYTSTYSSSISRYHRLNQSDKIGALMGAPPESPMRLIQFGVFELDVSAGELRSMAIESAFKNNL
jgi:hypothetical protein